ncbi:MAG: hypothetical protein B7Y99_11840 [Caulobacterales bacterium 32-69-10]|nr:MAG: hypothetical protein B7Y99_11840 [Caulobacterales bacterium 32-69-10]
MTAHAWAQALLSGAFGLWSQQGSAAPAAAFSSSGLTDAMPAIGMPLSAQVCCAATAATGL